MMAAPAFSLSSACKASIFSESSPVPLHFFLLKSFLRKGLLTVEVKKKIDQILGYISFYFEIRTYLGHLIT